MKSICEKLKLSKEIIVSLNELTKEYWSKQPLIGISTSDTDKMKNDWSKVGSDLKWAAEKYEKEKCKMMMK